MFNFRSSIRKFFFLVVALSSNTALTREQKEVKFLKPSDDPLETENYNKIYQEMIKRKIRIRYGNEIKVEPKSGNAFDYDLSDFSNFIRSVSLEESNPQPNRTAN